MYNRTDPVLFFYDTLVGDYKMDAKILDEKMKEIEKLQNDVAYILYNKNLLVRFFYHKKALKLHLEAGRKIDELFFGHFEKP